MPQKEQLKFSQINIGSGYDYKDNFINVDVDPACKPDILIIDNDDSEILRNHYELVYAKDVLEHISRDNTLQTLLNWSDYLKIGGILNVETSDIEGIIDIMREDSSFANQYGMTICMFGNQKHPGDFHYTGFTQKTLSVFLKAAGFDILSIETKDRWLINATAKKVHDWSFFDNKENIVDYAFKTALGRLPDPYHYIYFNDKPEKEILFSIWSSKERLFKSAIDNDL